MKGPSNEERLYPAAVMAFLIGLIGLGLLGLPALVVAAVGVAVAALAIGAFHRPLEGRGRRAHRSAAGRQRVPEKYAPSVLERGTRRRRRGVHRRRHRSASRPFIFADLTVLDCGSVPILEEVLKSGPRPFSNVSARRERVGFDVERSR